MLSLEVLKQHLRYEPETGAFFALQSTTRRKVGDRMDSVHACNGYVYVFVLGKSYAAGRLAWFYMTGEWPLHEVDHEDRNKTNNKWDNLRDLPHLDNCANRIFKVRAASGIKGVTFHKKTGKWRAENKGIYLGLHDSIELAAARITKHSGVPA